ncbi:carbohydrate-binding module family 50 protein [Aulographum hederae CBS 113979]|uniref:Carbohydrate-binding module family 50 protein n=1 Tax=Aulographum hederae CBS 113979 TaxID=1176131 RepID=A0A6G1H4S3_9PEZI|nr:carbohydrate-binding module family 50 protein [Aulographum hederae CBS 113979]
MAPQFRYLLFAISAIFTLLPRSDAQYRLHNADSSVLVGADDACLEAYNAEVSCPATIGFLYADRFPDLPKSALEGLCTGECFQSLVEHRNNVSKSCESDVHYYNNVDSSSWNVTFLEDEAIYAHNLTCLIRSDGQFCNSWFQQSRNDNRTTECDECYMKTVFMQAVSPVESDADEMRLIYSSMSSSCSYDGPSATEVEHFLLSSPTPSRSCSSMYAIQPEDTFLRISTSQNISTSALVNANGLTYHSSSLPSPGTLCITQRCSVYAVQKGDTCTDIARSVGLSVPQLRAWNPTINGHCSNLKDMVNRTLCTSNPLGDYAVTSSQGASTLTAPAAIPTSQLAPNTTTHCGQFYQVSSGDSCATITTKFNVELKDFLFLNPGVDQNCTQLWKNYNYCVQPVGDITTYPGYSASSTSIQFRPESLTPLPWDYSIASNQANRTIIPIADQSRRDCWSYFWVNSPHRSTFSCWDVADWSEISLEQFLMWNPSLDQKAPNATADSTQDDGCRLEPSVSYCNAIASPTPPAPVPSGPPSPRATDEIEGCTDWVQSLAAVSCQDVLLPAVRLSMSTFYKMNPSVKSDCSGAVNGMFYCCSTRDGGLPGISEEDDDETGDYPDASSTAGNETSWNGTSVPTVLLSSSAIGTALPTKSSSTGASYPKESSGLHSDYMSSTVSAVPNSAQLNEALSYPTSTTPS